MELKSTRIIIIMIIIILTLQSLSVVFFTTAHFEALPFRGRGFQN
jgi:hypothetical protein